jgi:hypothetical protein
VEIVLFGSACSTGGGGVRDELDLTGQIVDSAEGSSILCIVVRVHIMKCLHTNDCFKDGSFVP